MRPGPRPGPPRRHTLLLSGVAVSTSVNGLNSTMMAAVLLTVGRSLGIGDDVVWLVTSFYVASAVGLPVLGRLTDGWGSRNVLSLGLALVILGALGALVHDALWWLVTMRVLIGLGSSSAYPSSTRVLKMLAESSGTSTLRGLTVMTLSAQSTVMAAPALGALLVSTFGWQALFLVNVPMALYALVVARTTYPRMGPGQSVGKGLATTVRSAALFCLMISTGLLSLSIFPEPGWAPWLLCAAAAWAAYQLSERKSPVPFVDVSALRGEPLAMAAIIRQGAIMFMLYVTMYGLPVWVERSRGLDATIIGLMMVPLAGAGVVSTLLAPRLLRGLPATTVIRIGLLALAFASLLVVVLGPSVPVPVLVLLMGLLGLPNGLFMLGNQSIFLETVPARVVGVASGLLRTSQYVSASVSMVVVSQTMRRFSDADHAFTAIMVVVASTCLILVLELGLTRHLASRRGADDR